MYSHLQEKSRCTILNRTSLLKIKRARDKLKNKYSIILFALVKLLCSNLIDFISFNQIKSPNLSKDQ